MNCTCIDRVRPVRYQLTMENFEDEGCIRVHHVFYTVWSPPIRERRLDCAGLRCGARAQSLATSLTLSLTSCSSFPEREESPMLRSLGSDTAAESFLNTGTALPYVHMCITNVRTHTRVARRLGWGLILVEFNLGIFSCTAKLKPLPNFPAIR